MNRVVVKHRSPLSSERPFSQLSLNVEDQTALACLQRLILLTSRVYGHLHVAHRGGREGGFISSPFYSLGAVGFPSRATTLTTVNTQKGGMELCHTDSYSLVLPVA